MSALASIEALDLDGTPSSPDAVCVLEGPELWTSTEKKHRQRAAELCREGCPILAECLRAALDRGERWGTWGGLDLESAYRERPPRKQRTTAPCGTPSGYKRHIRRREPACEACKASRRLPAS